jgi:hypothetical protein
MEDKIMKKLMNLTEKDLLTVEGGDAVVNFNIATGSSTLFKSAYTSTCGIAYGCHTVQAVSCQKTKVTKCKVKSSNYLSICAY